MSRYFTRAAEVVDPSQHDADLPIEIRDDGRTMTVHESELETFTGLYTASGEPIHRTERIPMCFRFR